MPAATIYELLASLLEYPGADYPRRASRSALALAEVHPAAGLLLARFEEGIRGLSTEDLQALFTSTFDLDPVCTLEVGWHLFGEQYERGEFLVKMRQQMRRFGLAESSELPDHLTHVLAVLSRMEAEEADEFAAACVHPALDKMRAAWDRKENPFYHLLEAIALLLESRHPRAALEESPAPPELRVLDARSPR